MDFEKFLIENNIMPIEKWNSFIFCHKKPQSPDEENEQLIQLQKGLGEEKGNRRKGLYIYKRGKKILYVGKGNPIFNRLKSHYRESFTTVPGDTKYNTWHEFFRSYTGTVRIHWKEVEGETERRIIELMLQQLLDPEFDRFRHKYATEMRAKAAHKA